MATPTCFGMPPALGVVLLDRSDPLWRDGQQLKGKLGAVIVNGATDPADDPSVRLCADNMIKFFEQHEMPCVARSAATVRQMELGVETLPKMG